MHLVKKIELKNFLDYIVLILKKKRYYFIDSKLLAMSQNSPK